MASRSRPDPAGRGSESPVVVFEGGGLEIDWSHVARAFRAANQAVGWGAEITLTPERRHALVCFPRERAEHVGNTTSIFRRVVERHFGLEAFRSLGIDLEARPATHGSTPSSDEQRTR